MKELKQLGRYRLLKRISSGGMASIYEGRRESIEGVAPKVAVKVIDPKQAQDKDFRELFVNEALLSANLRHKNLIHVSHYCYQADWFVGLAMPRIVAGPEDEMLHYARGLAQPLMREVAQTTAR